MSGENVDPDKTLHFDPNYWETLTVYYACHSLCVWRIAGPVPYGADSDQVPRTVSCDPDLHCLLRPICPSA